MTAFSQPFAPISSPIEDRNEDRGLAAEQSEGTRFASRRPKPADRKFRSQAVDAFIAETQQRVGDPELAWLFGNCFPNTLDTTVEPGSFEGKPDTVVITGDIPAMWLRDSSAQVWPYLPLAGNDAALRELLEGVIRRQTRCILIDPYANAFMADLHAPPLEWSRSDKTGMKQGVGERKWELDSLCYPIRLAHGYWKRTGDTRPFDAAWQQAMRLVVSTMRVQQRKQGDGPYHFQRSSEIATETLPASGYGNPVRPVGLIASGFRPSDDACLFPFLVPSNLFAVTSLRQLAEMAHAVLADDVLANEAHALAAEVESALRQYATAETPEGTIWAYEVDGYGSRVLMDDANVPSLLGLPYLESSPDAALYARTRRFVWSERNPWFFRGTAGEGIGGPHEGKDMIWPMSQMVYALTSADDAEIRHALAMLKASSAGSGFMHESYFKDDPKRFTRAWFAWANTLFGELIATLAAKRSRLLQA
ncbi:glycoside hydrolase family 125 protein [Paracidobacterium acidisoli]|uniref:Glycoside hydrolase family 125 protein n=1 Tax=Paracidobacterium acidisoli TaxID=2303751 RepID=A0A372IRD7_9BACT|nr:glycoside hydrolase family 125 protein [Paracidobacterium acidisoli]MBT9330394.1 glycoside hydrolase family 125 protein [Paracidobacterium acidisoli]